MRETTKCCAYFYPFQGIRPEALVFPRPPGRNPSPTWNSNIFRNFSDCFAPIPVPRRQRVFGHFRGGWPRPLFPVFFVVVPVESVPNSVGGGGAVHVAAPPNAKFPGGKNKIKSFLSTNYTKKIPFFSLIIRKNQTTIPCRIFFSAIPNKPKEIHRTIHGSTNNYGEAYAFVQSCFPNSHITHGIMNSMKLLNICFPTMMIMSCMQSS